MAVNADKLFRKQCEFVAGAATLDRIPMSRQPEVAFAGRSNVGKSSLLNALTKKKNLARTSKTPGCTRQINFFLLGEDAMLVDLPGYGYARASKKEVDGWNRLIYDYLLGRPNLKQVCLLIDSRRGVKENDEEIMNLLDEDAVSYQIILTKTDKQSKEGVDKIIEHIHEIGAKHPALHPEVLQTSARDGKGFDVLRARIASFC